MKTNQSLQRRKNNVIARGLSNLAPIFIDKARNAEIWDLEGNRYIDFASGIAVVNTGHSHPQIVESVKAQLDRFSHSCFMVTPYESGVELAEKLVEIAPIDGDKKAIFVSTGAEAVENSIKIARAATGRRGVIAFHGSFHGRTNMTMALTGKMSPYKNQFGPFPSDIYHAPFPIAYHGISIEDSLNAIDTIFKVNIAAQDVAAIIIEPVQGEGGFYPAPPAFLAALRNLCDQHGILFIADEIQTGFARTGKWFAMEHAGVKPDLMTMAKGIAGGFPLAAVVGKANLMDAPQAGGLGGTYAASPVACSAALEVLDIIEKMQLAAQAEKIGQYFQEHLQALQQEYPQLIGEIRTLGAMIALELVENGDAQMPNAALTQALIKNAPQHGLILLACGARGNVIRFLPPLTIDSASLQTGLAAFEKCFAEAASA